MKTQTERTSAFWAEAWPSGQGLFWTDAASVQKRLNAKVSGDPNTDWVEYTLQHHVGRCLPLSRFLNLGCGHGHLERRLSRLGAFIAYDAFDISQEAISEARQLASAEGCDNITYTVQDINYIHLPTQMCDAVRAHASIHHFGRLENVFEQVAIALKPGSLFTLNEYVGPNRFQFPPRQRQAIQACHNLLPTDYRRLTATALDHSPTSRGKEAIGWWARRVIEKLRDGDLPGAVWHRLQRLWSTRSGDCPIKITPNQGLCSLFPGGAIAA